MRYANMMMAHIHLIKQATEPKAKQLNIDIIYNRKKDNLYVSKDNRFS